MKPKVAAVMKPTERNCESRYQSRPSKHGRARSVRCPADAPGHWQKGPRRSRPSLYCY